VIAWLLAAAMLAAAVAFVAVPLVRSTRAARASGSALPADPESPNARLARAIYRDRVAELEAESAAGRLDPDVKGQVLEELGTALLDDYEELEAAGARGASAGSAGTRAPRFAWALALLLPVAALGLYWSIGEPTAASITGAIKVLSLDPERERPELERWRSRLERRVEQKPEDAASWFLLGGTRLQLGQFDRAAEAFARAAAINGPDPVVDVYWLQARYLAAGGGFDAGSREIAERILGRESNHPVVLELYAIDAFRQGDFRAAVGYLNRALMNDLGEGRVRALVAALEEARAQMPPLKPSVAVEVSAPAGAPPDATLFVIARPPGGGMPYAVVRRPATLVPLTVNLDDTVSMNPALPLSAAAGFEVIARLSRSGMPAAQPGDWEWRSAPLTTAELTEPVRLQAVLAAPAAPADSAAPALPPGHPPLASPPDRASAPADTRRDERPTPVSAPPADTRRAAPPLGKSGSKTPGT
jgi:cytochrome c-type biogenesis protein CcmH